VLFAAAAMVGHSYILELVAFAVVIGVFVIETPLRAMPPGVVKVAVNTTLPADPTVPIITVGQILKTAPAGAFEVYNAI
jgi:hypothetical protein